MSNDTIEVYYYGEGFADDTTEEILKEELLIGFGFSLKKCEQINCKEITIYVPTLQNLEATIPQRALGNIAKNLQKKKQAHFKGISLKVSTPHMRSPNSIITSPIVLAIYPTLDMLEKLESQARNLKILVIVPYVLSELQEWLKKHQAKPILLKR